MRKLFLAALIVAATFTMGLAQDASGQDQPNRGVAPKEANGIGRADVRIVDADGNPVRNAYVKLESTRSDGFFCESWGWTDANGVVVLPPIHMGTLKMVVKAKGFKTQKVEVMASSLSEPVRITMVRK